MSTPIEEYAVIGDTETVALISRAGSIDWLCLPRFDSPACFAAILGAPEHGRWLLGPLGEAQSTRQYRGDSFILETIHQTSTGSVRITELMPLTGGRADIIRVVEGLSGNVELLHEWVVRLGYGRIRPWVSHSGGHAQDTDVLAAIAGNDMLVLRGSRLPQAGPGGTHRDVFTVRAGERLEFSMSWFASYKPIPAPLDIPSRITDTYEHSASWAAQVRYVGPYRQPLIRSLLTLRLLTDTRRGGIVAAATTSLPEDFGGVRNWDYRYCWLRDAALTVEALLRAGLVDSTVLWRDWLVRAIAGDPEDMQIMYAVDGSRELPERVLEHLPGYAHSRPVRVGNAAVAQKQTDVLGEVMIALEDARRLGLSESEQSWEVQRALVDNLAQHWQEPDNGVWEIRGPLRHFTHSRVMVWAAFDRAIQAIERHGYPGPLEKWRTMRHRVRAQVLEEGWNSERGTFTQHYDTDEVDASLLLIPLVGFLPPEDPRVLGTIAAIEQDLMRDGLLLRYRTDTGVDGLDGGEHPFLACSWWLVSAYAKTGELDKATALMDRLVGLLNDVGLIAEEYDVENRRMAGNFPQAFSHLALIGAAYAIADASVEIGELRLAVAEVGPLGNRSYVLTCRHTGEQVLIDAAAEPETLLGLIDASAGRSPLQIVTTHRHRDHTGALAELGTRTGARTAAGDRDADDLPIQVDQRLRHGDSVRIGGQMLEVIGLAGHTPGGIALAYREPAHSDARTHLFVGDSLFPGGVGATNQFPYQSFPQLFSQVCERLFGVFADSAVVYPGHGPSTTLGAQRPYLSQWQERGW